MSIPLDVITEILSLLPVKSLLRFRCVSKQLCASIDSPEFIKLHLSRSKETYSKSNLILEGHFGFFSASMDSLDIAVQMLDHPLDSYTENPVKVIGCCNGLLALQRFLGNEVYLLNPSTKKHQILPDIVIDSEYYNNNVTRYNASTDDYKLVRIIISRENVCVHSFKILRSEQVFVYSLKNNSWTRVQDFSYHSFLTYGLCGSGALVGGTLNWLQLEWGYPFCVIAFDLKNENFSVVPLPHDMTNKNFYFKFLNNLSVLGGCPSVTWLNTRNQDCCDIWVMKEYGIKESWTKLLSFSFSFSLSPKDAYLKGAIAYSNCGNRVLLRVHDYHFCWYDLKEQSSHKFQIPGLPQHFWSETTVCVESLVSPRGTI